MSLKQFLVVGRSFIGMRSEKSPYELRKENLLPNFSTARTVGPKKDELVQADWVEQQERLARARVQAAALASANNAKTELFPAPAAQAHPVQKKPWNWTRFLSLGLLGKSQNNIPLVQSELSLDRISVVRNDLADSDLELVIKKNKKIKKAPTNATRAADSEASQWSRLTARLFEIGQEQ